MKIIWDTKKERKNIRKHKISFSYAAEVFYDPAAIIEFDDAHSVDEDRYVVIGKANNEIILFVVETEVDDDTLKIITARKAKKKEKIKYAGGI